MVFPSEIPYIPASATDLRHATNKAVFSYVIEQATESARVLLPVKENDSVTN